MQFRLYLIIWLTIFFSLNAVICELVECLCRLAEGLTTLAQAIEVAPRSESLYVGNIHPKDIIYNNRQIALIYYRLKCFRLMTKIPHKIYCSNTIE